MIQLFILFYLIISFRFVSFRFISFHFISWFDIVGFSLVRFYFLVNVAQSLVGVFICYVFVRLLKIWAQLPLRGLPFSLLVSWLDCFANFVKIFVRQRKFGHSFRCRGYVLFGLKLANMVGGEQLNIWQVAELFKIFICIILFYFNLFIIYLIIFNMSLKISQYRSRWIVQIKYPVAFQQWVVKDDGI